MHFGLRGCEEHRDMCWGGVKLKQTEDGEKSSEANSRQRGIYSSATAEALPRWKGLMPLEDSDDE